MSNPQHDLDRIVAELNQTSARQREAASSAASGQPNSELLDLLTLAHEQYASDLLLVAGSAPILRKSGRLSRVAVKSLVADDIPRLVLPLLSSRQYSVLQKRKTVDIAFSLPALGRFRANVHYQSSTLAASIRLLPRSVPTLESLHLPDSLRRMASLRQGLVLVTGPTGVGKSSTQAAIIDAINRSRECHVITIEEPIEYVHSNQLAVIEQIEVGVDTPSFLSTLRSILRQSPDVILVGEMRDAETISTVLRAAETGHLVLSTLHTNDTSQAISRILDAVPSANQTQIRMQVSLALAGVIAQQLVPGMRPGILRPAVEILLASDAVRHLIRHGLDHQLRSQLLMSGAMGMVTMEQSLAELVRSRIIAPDVAIAHSPRPDELKDLLGI